jgi:hypothetical protein
LRLQQESTRQEQVRTTGRQGSHARPQRRECPHEGTLAGAGVLIVVRSGHRALILKEDAESPAQQGKISPSGDDAATTSWDRDRP